MVEFTRVQEDDLRRLCEEVFLGMGLTREDALITTDVLLAADLRGIDSHGVARLSFYYDGLKSGLMKARAETQVISETPTTALIDAGGGMGAPVSYRAMQKAIQKAQDLGLGMVTVRNSNHYGIAGYYAMMALDAGCIGMSTTNSAVFVVPTYGRDARLGTNPIAVAAPAGEERPYVLDMATSVVPFGKLENYSRLGKSIPLGWATDEQGLPTTDPVGLVKTMRGGSRLGGISPLGGHSEEQGGHKGYGLAVLVDVLSAVLPGALYANAVYPTTDEGKPKPSGIGHFFSAIRVDAFRPLDEFKASMDDLQRRLKTAPKAEGQERIYIHGEKEFEETERRKRDGIPLNPKVVADLTRVAGELGIAVKL